MPGFTHFSVDLNCSGLPASFWNWSQASNFVGRGKRGGAAGSTGFAGAINFERLSPWAVWMHGVWGGLEVRERLESNQSMPSAVSLCILI